MLRGALEQNPGVRIQKPEYQAEAASTDFLSFLLTPEFWILTSAFRRGIRFADLSVNVGARINSVHQRYFMTIRRRGGRTFHGRI
jgi:hypothetical protein